MFVTKDPLGNPVDRRHPWNQHTNPQPQKRDFDDKYSWVMSPRWFDGTDHLALDTGGGPIARLWSTALSGLVDTEHLKATGTQRADPPAADRPQARGHLRVEDPAVVEHHRAQPGAHLLPGLRRGGRPRLRREGARRRAGRPDQDVGAVRGARRGHRLRVHRGGPRRAVAPHGHQGRQDRQLPPVPADAVERQPARLLRHARPLRGRRDEHTDLRGERSRQLQGHRHHARRAQLRPVPAVRRAHVPRQGQGPAARCTRPRRSPTPSSPERRPWPTRRTPGTSATASSACSTTSTLPSTGAPMRPSRSSCAWSPSCTAAAWRASSSWRRRGPSLLDRSATTSWSPACSSSTDSTRPTSTDRVEAALESVRPFLAHHDGDVELLDIDPDAGAVLLRLLGSCDGCPSSAVTLQLAVERAIVDAAPEIVHHRRRRAGAEHVSGPETPVDADPQAACRPLPDGGRRWSRAPASAARTSLPRAARRRAGASRAPQPRRERCELCGEQIADAHGHVVDLEHRSLCAPAAAATSCSPPTAPVGRSSAPCPTATVAFPDVRLTPAQWDALQIPVSVAFFFVNSVARPGRRLLPEPGGRHRVAAAARRVGRRRRGQPGARRRWPRRRGVPRARRRRERRGRVLPRADRRLLRAGRPAAPAVAGLRRRRRGATRALDAFFDRVRARARSVAMSA